MNEGDWIAVAAVAIIGAIVVAALYFQAQVNRRRLDVIRAAIEANQPDVAQALLTTRWSQIVMRGLKMAGIGLVLVVAGAMRPELAGLLLLGGVLVAAGVPVAVYAAVREHYPDKVGAPWLAVGIIVLSLVTLPVAGYWVLGHGSPENSRARVMWRLQPLAAEQEFRQRVLKLTGSPVGTVHPVINGHRAEPLLTGAVCAMQSCGSPFHKELRFETVKPSYLNVFYLPDIQQYFVVGEARVTPAYVVVIDGPIAAREALRSPGQGARAP